MIDLAYTATTPPFILTAVKNIIKRINQRGIMITELKATGEETYILPFVVANNYGCGFMTGWERDTDVQPSEKEKLLYKARQRDYDQFGASIENITNFGDGKTANFLNCILLKSIIMPLGMH